MSGGCPMAVLMCHAPIVVPAVGGHRADDCAHTTAAMREVARRLVASPPDVLVVISPHAPRRATAWGLLPGPFVQGDFGAFGAPQTAHRFPVPEPARQALARAAEAAGLETWEPPRRPLDHGALVPLHFVAEAGWHGPTLVLALPWPGTETEAAMGSTLAQVARERSERWHVLASGDLSHRLRPDAPAGYHPRAAHFDRALADALGAGDLRAAAAIDPALRELAAEDVIDSVIVAAGAIGWDSTGHALLAYEGPFGVGYLEAVLRDAPVT